MKTFLNRLHLLSRLEFLATAMDDQEEAVDIPIKDIEGWIKCFPGI